MEYTTENAILQIVRIKDDGDWGGIIKHSLMPSQFYVIEKKPEVTSSFYFNLTEPSAVFTLTKSDSKFLMELLLSKAVLFNEDHFFDKKRMKPSQIGDFVMDDLNMKINILENCPMWIDDSEIQSVTEFCIKCRRMKEEHHIQFAVIDDFINLPTPKSVLEGRAAPDAAYKQLCQLAKELDIVVVALLDSSLYHSDDE
jgi:replicative DNA helicase